MTSAPAVPFFRSATGTETFDVPYQMIGTLETALTPEQAARLLELGCELGQGHQLSKPMAAAEACRSSTVPTRCPNSSKVIAPNRLIPAAMTRPTLMVA